MSAAWTTWPGTRCRCRRPPASDFASLAIDALTPLSGRPPVGLIRPAGPGHLRPWPRCPPLQPPLDASARDPDDPPARPHGRPSPLGHRNPAGQPVNHRQRMNPAATPGRKAHFQAVIFASLAMCLSLSGGFFPRLQPVPLSRLRRGGRLPKCPDFSVPVPPRQDFAQGF